MRGQKRYAILFMDNTISHKVDSKLISVKMQMLFANAMSCLQPLDQGVMKMCMKIIHHERLLPSAFTCITARNSLAQLVKSVSALGVNVRINVSMKDVISKTFARCFENRGILSSDSPTVDLELDEDNVSLARLLQRRISKSHLV